MYGWIRQMQGSNDFEAVDKAKGDVVKEQRFVDAAGALLQRNLKPELVDNLQRTIDGHKVLQANETGDQVFEARYAGHDAQNIAASNAVLKAIKENSKDLVNILQHSNDTQTVVI